jgi:NADH dehydrogenase (ubiquinone) Fe-S protein 6
MQPLRSYLYRTTTSCASQNPLDFHFLFRLLAFLGHSRIFSHTLTHSSCLPTNANSHTMISSRLAARLCPRLGRRLYSSNPVAPAASVPAEAKQQAVAPQSPNRAAAWSTSQSPRPAGQSGPRFEQTVMELQPNPLSAMELLANEPVLLVDGRRAICDGGGSTQLRHGDSDVRPNHFFKGSGPLGHPKIYINLVGSLGIEVMGVRSSFLNRTNPDLDHAGKLCFSQLS